eukprot:scaffold101864_cov22-Prasinocladus_malaysianus.AAC.1
MLNSVRHTVAHRRPQSRSTTMKAYGNVRGRGWTSRASAVRCVTRTSFGSSCPPARRRRRSQSRVLNQALNSTSLNGFDSQLLFSSAMTSKEGAAARLALASSRTLQAVPFNFYCVLSTRLRRTL